MAKKTRIEDIDSEAVINSFRLDDNKHSAGSEKHGRERSCPTSERSDTRSRFSTRLALQRGAGTQAQEQQAGKIGL